ncbi:MAG: PilZ domain-containing protein [Desulfobulbaceae bacterium]|nr:MAG: PilZ domain-containing protein [Desulfobulbaceae bacterium]
MEKRRFSRIGFAMAAMLTVEEKLYVFDHVKNLSIGGCMFETRDQFKPGQPCRLWIPLEPADPELGVEVFGEVVRSDQGHVSLRFTRIDPDSLFHLQNILRYNSEDVDRIEGEIDRHPGLV